MGGTRGFYAFIFPTRVGSFGRGDDPALVCLQTQIRRKASAGALADGAIGQLARTPGLCECRYTTNPAYAMKSHNLAYIPALDHLRLLAALLVLVFHTFHLYFGLWQPAPYAAALGLVTEGHTGVALFFVLSGFLFMTIALQSERIDYGAFMRNRFLRIFPLFLFFFFIAISVGRDAFRAGDVLYVFFSNLGQAPTSGSFITGAAWTISVEFTFYLVFPFLARFVRAEGAAYLLRLIALMALVKLAAWGGVRTVHTHVLFDPGGAF